MTCSPNSIRAARRSRETAAASGEHVASVVPNYKITKNQILKKKAPVQRPGHICRAGNNCRAAPLGRLWPGRVKHQPKPIDAIAQAGRFRPVGEDVTHM